MTPSTPLTTRAPAKINLSLHVLGRRADGLHDLESLVAFAGAGDNLRLVPGGALRLSVSGPTAPAAGPETDNLVLRAARALADLPRAKVPRAAAPVRFRKLLLLDMAVTLS